MEGAPETRTNAVAAAVPGIDVSHYQPAVDWAAVVRTGFQYCFIKATEGVASVDRSFDRHWQDVRKAGLLRGAYHFFRPRVSALAQANLFLRIVKDLESGDLPPVLDLEAPDDWSGIPCQDRAGLAIAWLEAVEQRLGITPLVYLSPSFACEVLGNTAALARYPVWVAQYTQSEAPTIPKPWNSWTFWQHSNTRTTGISVPVDLDWFNGSRENLKALARS